MNEVASRQWWGLLASEADVVHRCNVGPLVAWFQRMPCDVVVAWETIPKNDQDDYPTPAILRAVPAVPLLDQLNVERFAFESEGTQLSVTPALADRPVITSPRKPLFILPHAKVTIFASSPLWLRADAGTERILDVAVDRPSDTWFGPTTLKGEFCYATKAFCRLRLREIQTPLHRAVTAITVHNHADSAIKVHKMKLPAPNLALYADPSGRLWTEDVRFDRTDGDEGFASLEIAHRAPRHATSPVRVAEPREEVGEGSVIRAFSSIFPRSSG